MNSLYELTTKYIPITANPYRQSKAYTEISPCAELAPYIRCFWGTTEPIIRNDEHCDLVIPDTCMDVIFTIDYKSNRLESGFCTIDETGHYTNAVTDTALYSTFAIRFYAWSAVLFADNYFSDSKNQFFDTDEFFTGLNREMLPMLMSVTCLKERAVYASRYLMKRLNIKNINNDMMNAVYDIIAAKGTISTAELAKRNVISKRQLERIFQQNMGITPKSFSSLVRYQMMWQEMCFEGGNTLDMIEKYGYYDQAHLLNDFKKRHTMTPTQAIKLLR